MKKQPQITAFELMMLPIGSALSFPYTILPVLTASPANQDVWIVVLLAAAYMVIINAPLLYLLNKCRGLSPSEIAQTILGKAAGKIMLVPAALLCLFCFTACMAIGARFLKIYMFPNTPNWALFVYFAVPACYAAIKGAGTLCRLASFIVPFVIFSIIVFFILGLEKMDMLQFQPVLADSTFLQLNKGAFLTAARFSEIMIFFVFTRYLRQKYSLNKTFFSALGTFGLCFLAMTVSTVAVLGVDFAKISFNPYFTFTRQIQAFGFLERVQSLGLLAWVPMLMLKLATYLYMTSEIAAGIVGAKSPKGFVVPFAFVGFVVALLPVMTLYTTLATLRSDQVMPYLFLPVTFVLPVVFVLVYTIRQKKLKPIIQKMQVTDPPPSK